MFNLDILKKLGNHHKTLMSIISIQIDNFTSDKDIYEFINKYYKENNLSKAFPIGISINKVIAHNSYHEKSLTLLKPGDFIKIDFGIIEELNLIDGARTFIYKKLLVPENINKSLDDCKNIVLKIEDYIRKQIETDGKVLIQRISTLTNALILSKGYNSIGLLGGHTIELGKVHGSKLILNKPLNLLPSQALNFINATDEIGEEEMFAIEVYIPDEKTEGEMIQSIQIPITHYELDLMLINNTKLSTDEENVLDKITEETKGLVYEYHVHKKYSEKIIKELERKNIIKQHHALEFISKTRPEVKYVQYEDCYLVRDKKLINLTNNK